MDEDRIFQQRKEKVINFLKVKYNYLAYLVLAVIVFIAVWIRTRNLPGLRDVTTGGWTLGPDLDPFLFMRWSDYIVQHGSLMSWDFMRYVPIGFETRYELTFLPYLMAWFHKVFYAMGVTVSVEHSAVLFPVFMFALTVVAFFFLVRKIFSGSLNPLKSNIIALIASFFLSVLPVILPRTIAGIPEKESAGFFFLFLTFYLFLSAWKARRMVPMVILSVLSGVATAMMALIWGGVVYIFVTFGIALFVSFIIGQLNKQRFYAGVLWLASSFFLMGLGSSRYTLSNLITSTTTGIPILVLVFFAVQLAIFETPIRKYFNSPWISKVPKPIVAMAAVILLGGILLSIIFGMGFITHKISDVTSLLITPISDRLGVTVAENRQPYFGEWASSFGPYIAGIPIFFWLFFLGSIYLFYNLLASLNKRSRILATVGYTVFLIALIFSRYSPSSMFNGTNGISLLFYILGVLVLMFLLGFGGIRRSGSKVLSYYYYSYGALGVILLIWTIFSIQNAVFSVILALAFIPAAILTLVGVIQEEEYRKVDFGWLMLFSLFFLSIVSARGAVRTIMLLVPPTSIIVAYFVTETAFKVHSIKDKSAQFFGWMAVAVLIIAAIFSGYSFYSSSVGTASGYIPNQYTQQWQNAMSWVRENTPESAVFGHWWDYGYWVQTMGKRATVLDGGNVIPYWNHLMGRHALTAPDDSKGLEYLYAHNATHFIIDSTDIGKYGAFSSIGADENYDRASYISTFIRDSRQTLETKNSTAFVYQNNVFGIEDDWVYSSNGTNVTLFAGRAAVVGFIVKKDSSGNLAGQPTAAVIDCLSCAQQGRAFNRYEIPLKYIYDGELRTFSSGMDAGIFLLPRVVQSGSGASIENDGALIYLSPRTVKSQVARLFLYNEDNPNFKLVHSEDDALVAQLKKQGLTTSDFVVFDSIRGPLRIWEIHYPQGIEKRDEYLLSDYPTEALKKAR